MKIKHLDYLLLFVVALFLILGLSFLATISAPASLKRFGTTSYYLTHQLIYGVGIGIFLGLVAFLTPLKWLRKAAPFLVLLNLIVLVAVLLPKIGSRFWGGTRWISIFGVSFQPSEFLKLTSIFYLASWLRNRMGAQVRTALIKNRGAYHNFKNILIPFIVFLTVISVLLILQPDMSTLAIIALTALVMYFVSGTPKWHTLLVMAGGALLVFLLVKIEPYRFSRLITFLNPDIDPLGIGYQSKQSLIAVGSGGLTGQGLGMSGQKFGFLPQSMSDSTFAIFAEETGFIGCFILLSLFFMFLWLGLMIARRSDDKFSRLTALGITFWIIFQGFVNISSMIGLFPLSGIPLPFISYGGSHLVAELIGVGILLNIARHQKA